MISLDFLLGALMAIFGVPFLIFAGLLLKRLPLLVGIILLARSTDNDWRVTARSALALLLVLWITALSAVSGVLLVVKAVMLWTS